MASIGKKLIREFYTSDFHKGSEDLKQYLHPDAELFWNSSSGFKKMNFTQIAAMIEGFSQSFSSLRAQISHLIKEKDTCCIRFTYFVKTVENPEEELPMAHFMAIWEIKDEKLFKGFQITQQADDSPENLSSYLSINL